MPNPSVPFRATQALRSLGMKVTLRNPTRDLTFAGPMSVVKLLGQLELNRESVLVIENGTLVPGDAILADEAEIEIRPVISGGATSP